MRSLEARAALLPDVEGSVTVENRTENLAALGIHVDRHADSGVRLSHLRRPVHHVRCARHGHAERFRFQRHPPLSGVEGGRDRGAVRFRQQPPSRWRRKWRAPIWPRCGPTPMWKPRRPTSRSPKRCLSRRAIRRTPAPGTGIEITRASVQLANDRQQLLVDAKRAPRRASATAARHGHAPRYRTRTHRQAAVHAGGCRDAGSGAQGAGARGARRSASAAGSGKRTRGSRPAPPRWSACLRWRHSAITASIGTALTMPLPTRTVGISTASADLRWRPPRGASAPNRLRNTAPKKSAPTI